MVIPQYCERDETSECKDYSGCKWMGLMTACGDENKIPVDYLKTNYVVAFISKAQSKLKTRDQRIKFWQKHYGEQNIEITLSYKNESLTFNAIILDTCDDTDCDGCCSKNMGDEDALIDIEFESLNRLSNENKQFMQRTVGNDLNDYFFTPCKEYCNTCDKRIENKTKCTEKCGAGTVVPLEELPFKVSWKFVKNKIKPPENCNK